jgi:hypothetical protein
MQSIKIQTKKLVESEMVIPPFFTIKDTCTYYKILSDQSYLTIKNYESDVHTMEAFDLYPAIRVDKVRFLEIFVNGKEVIEMTEQEFNNEYEKCIKQIASL